MSDINSIQAIMKCDYSMDFNVHDAFMEAILEKLDDDQHTLDVIEREYQYLVKVYEKLKEHGVVI